MKKPNKNKHFLTLIIIAIILGVFTGSLLLTQRTIPESSVRIRVPAVNTEGEGMLATLSVEIKPGDGKVLTDIENILFWADTQLSIQTATKVAEDYTKADLSNYDLIYKMEGEEVTLVGGGSAGASLAIATIAAIENKTLDPTITITGAIDENGTIGEVGALKEKAEAVHRGYISTFLVPLGQSKLNILIPKKICEVEDSKEICKVDYIKGSLSDLGPKVYEVKDIKEAAGYFDL